MDQLGLSRRWLISVNLILSIQYRHADRWLFPDILSIDQAVSSAGLGPR
jgi:hypothetical protein